MLVRLRRHYVEEERLNTPSEEAHYALRRLPFWLSPGRRGSLRVDANTYDHDLLIDRGEIHKRKKKPSKKFRDDFGHTPLSVEEDIPWKCCRLVVGTGAYGRLPVMKEVKHEPQRRNVELVILPTIQAIEALNKLDEETNAILHVTC